MNRQELFVPGRLCLFGEHSDWAGARRTDDPGIMPGRCIIAGTDQGILASARPATGVFELRQISADGSPAPPDSIPADPAALKAVAGAAGFDSYAAGTACLVLGRFPGLGLRLEVLERTLPLKKGLSSSAAVCVLTARAFNLVHDLGLSIEEEMDLAYRGELMTGSACGRMDQACAFGGVPVELTFDGDSMGISELVPGSAFHLLIVDLGVSKDTRRILADLNAAFDAGEPGMRAALGPVNLDMLARARRMLEAGDPEALGSLMTEAQDLFDRFVAPCSTALESPALHAALSHPAVREYAWGGKGVGSQGDGSAQFVCRGAEERRLLAAALEREPGVACLDLTIRASLQPAPGAPPRDRF